jgi:hypothetical protein
MPNDELPAIDPELLATVTGGANADEQVTMMLQNLMSSIKELAGSQQNNGNDQLMQMLPFLMMMRNRQSAPRPAPPAPTPPPGDGWVRVA